MSIVTLVIAVLGVVLSVANFVVSWLSQRRRLRIRVEHALFSESTLVLFVQFENQSRLPVAITRIRLKHEGAFVDCEAIPKVVLEKSRSDGGVVYERKIFYSEQIPVSISSLGAASGFVLFENLQKPFPPFATHATLLIATNRGAEFETSLSLRQIRAIPLL